MLVLKNKVIEGKVKRQIQICLEEEVCKNLLNSLVKRNADFMLSLKKSSKIGFIVGMAAALWQMYMADPN